MKKKILTSIICMLCVACTCVSLGSCGPTEGFKDWFSALIGEADDLPQDDSTDDSTDDEKDDESGDTSTDDSTDTSTDGSTGEDSTDSSTGDESGDNSTDDGVNGDGSAVTDFPFFVGNGTAFEDDYVYIMPEKGICSPGDTFRIRAEAVDGSTPTFTYLNDARNYLSVDERGNVTALASGRAYISVTFAQMSYIVEIVVLGA